MAGFAMMGYVPQGPEPVEFPSTINHTLTSEERVGILRNGKVLIEYFYNKTCIECPEKETMYVNFVKSKETENLIVLAHGTATNETSDWMINIDGTQIDLTEINSTQELRKMFCDVAFIKPNVCILQEI